MNSVKHFVDYIHTTIPFGFSARMEVIYSETLNWMRTEPHMQGFEHGEADLADNTPYSVAVQYFKFFQAHYMKMYFSLLDLVKEQLDHNELSWLEKPVLNILDIGAGSGAGSIAMLDLLCSYHEYCWKHNFLTYPTQVAILAIEPSEHPINVWMHMLKALKGEIESAQITFHANHIKCKFPRPYCVTEIKKYWQSTTINSILIISSNVIKWTQGEHGKIQEFLNYFGGDKIPELGEIEAKVVNDLVEHFKPNNLVLLDIATRNKLKAVPLWTHLRKAIRSFMDFFSHDKSGIIKWRKVESEKGIRFFNSPKSYYGQRESSIKAHSNPPFLQSIRLGKSNILHCASWNQTVDRENLILAWIRARHYILRDDIIDEIEIRLTDAKWQNYLDRILCHLQCRQFHIVDTQNRLDYWGPKKATDSRPRYLLKLNEQLLSAAFSQANPTAFDPVNSDHILGNRLNPKKNEFFYQPWFRQFDSYSKMVAEYADPNDIVCKLDIKSYYVNIKQGNLLRQLRTEIGFHNQSPLYEMFNIIINHRLQPPHVQGSGLPQSGIAAGLWSSLYLKTIDQEMLLGNPKVKYFRYADDMTVIAPEEQLEPILERIQDRMKGAGRNSLGLEFNVEKENRTTIKDYRNDYKFETRFNQLGKQSRDVVNVLYHLPRSYKQQLKNQPNLFINDYQDLLNAIGIYSVDFPFWLNRKLYQHSVILDDVVFKIKRVFGLSLRIYFPSYEFGLTKDKKLAWRDEFIKQNSSWLTAKRNIMINLTKFFNDGYALYKQSSGDERKQARRILRFSAYRLSWFGVASIAEKLIDIMRISPWDLDGKNILKALVESGYQDQVLGLAIEWRQRQLPIKASNQNIHECLRCAASLCATACRALEFGSMNTDLNEFLWNTLFDTQSKVIEKIATSQSLIKFRIDSSRQEVQILKLAESYSNQPYLLKNLILLLSCSTNDNWESNTEKIANLNSAFIVSDALQFALFNSQSIFSVQEPAIIESYYATWYPDVITRSSSSSLMN